MRTDLTQKTKNKKVTITLRDNQSYQNVRLTRSGPDSTSWIFTNGTVMSRPTKEISEVRYISRGRGALEGFGVGLLVGALTGAIIGLADGDDPEGEVFSFTADEKAFIGGIFFGGLGGLVGLPVGAGIGSKDIYRVEQETAQTETTTLK